jgi:hypothetical protein
MQSERPFQARVVLIDRESVLTEQAVSAFAEAHGFRMFPEDGVAINGHIRFSVETFEPAEGFKPTKPYVTRIVWRDFESNIQSKLLMTRPERVLAVVVTGEDKAAAEVEAGPSAARQTASAEGPRRSRRTPAAAPA